MTDQIDQITNDVADVPTETATPNRRRMFIAGAGLAGAAALVGSKSASAADDDPVLVGNPDNTTADGATVITNTNGTATTAGTPGQEAVLGQLTGAGNGSHAVRGITAGLGHGIAGENTLRENTVGATWGRHSGLGAGTSGVNIAADVPIAGTARGAEGIITDPTNGSHAVFGRTVGGGHSVAGDTPADAAGPGGTGPNTTAATWGRHAGLGAGVGGVNTNTNVVPIAGSSRAVEGTVVAPTNGSHAVFGETFGGGHSIAGDTPADAAGPNGDGRNTTAATWGRHGGIGAGIGGVSAEGYGGEFVGGKASARLIPSEGVATGAPTDDGHLRGELYVDGAGVLWYNTSDGNNWIPLSQGGNVLWVDPARAYDSRANKPTPANSNKTKFAAGEIRSIDLTEFTDFPATATAALINLTVVNAEGRGYATLFNGATADADRPDTSNINWDTNTGTDVVANSATVRADLNGVIKVYTSMPTNIVIDIQGYIA